MNEKYPNFLFSYRMDGSQWSFSLPAKDFDDAQRRLAAIAMTGKVDGECFAQIPAYRGFWVPAWVWLKNRGWI
jgi:hypothetical protein